MCVCVCVCVCVCSCTYAFKISISFMSAFIGRARSHVLRVNALDASKCVYVCVRARCCGVRERQCVCACVCVSFVCVYGACVCVCGVCVGVWVCVFVCGECMYCMNAIHTMHAFMMHASYTPGGEGCSWRDGEGLGTCCQNSKAEHLFQHHT